MRHSAAFTRTRYGVTDIVPLILIIGMSMLSEYRVSAADLKALRPLCGFIPDASSRRLVQHAFAFATSLAFFIGVFGELAAGSCCFPWPVPGHNLWFATSCGQYAVPVATSVALHIPSCS